MRSPALRDELNQARTEAKTATAKLEAVLEASVTELAGALEETTAQQETISGSLRDKLSKSIERLHAIESSLEGLSQIRASLDGLEARLRQELASATSAQQGQLKALEGRSSKTAETLQKELSAERSQRIVEFARRDSSGRELSHVVLIVCPPRTGSTWLYDALRCHPRVVVEPTAQIV